MKAVRLVEYEKPVEVHDIDPPEPQEGEALIRMQASALNHRDLYVTQGLYPGITVPSTLGSDGTGIVEGIGHEVSEEWMGRSVIINPGIEWGDDQRVQSKDFRVLGNPDEGTFAEYFTIHTKYLHPVPAHLSVEQAAALPLGGLTAYRALFFRGELSQGDKVLITGIGGGVAQTALKLALPTASEVYVTSGSDEKLKKAKELGASGGANYKEDEWWKKLKEEAGPFDLILDSAGGEGFKRLIELASGGGRIVFYGGTKGKIPDLLPQPIFWKQLSLLGSTMGSDQDFRDMMEQVIAHRIAPEVDRSFSLTEAPKAFEHLEQQGQFGKVLLRNEA
jgi:NADPH:quinone reductase-like Zn-dependent oxidoreductase